jgi:hypothetical protein
MSEIPRMSADFARCEAKHCPKKETCLRFRSEPYWADHRQVYLYHLDVSKCSDFVPLPVTDQGEDHPNSQDQQSTPRGG